MQMQEHCKLTLCQKHTNVILAIDPSLIPRPQHHTAFPWAVGRQASYIYP
jgi:hypothetical protein